MSKSKRLLDLMMTVNRRRKFTVRELADEFGVSTLDHSPGFAGAG